MGSDNGNGISGKRLLSFIERIERIIEEKAGLNDDLKEIYAEAKGVGYDPKIIRLLIEERATDADALRELNTILDLYRDALGALANTPLGEAAVDRERGKRKKPGRDAAAEARP